MRERYELLIQEFCQAVGMQDPHYVAQGGAFEVEGVTFSFIHHTQAAPATVFLCADFGTPPTEREATVYHDLLKRNFLMFMGKGHTYTISPLTGHVIYVERFELEHTRAELLAQTCADLAVEILDWRQTRFLSGPRMLRPAATPTTPTTPTSTLIA